MSRAKVIAVDDDPIITQLVRSRLEGIRIPCDVASSAEQALLLMRQNLYFVVIADIHMPGMDGVAMVSALKDISPLVQVIMLTIDASMEQVIACADRGVVDFFSKDNDYDELVESVGVVLRRRARWADWIGHPATQTV